MDGPFMFKSEYTPKVSQGCVEFGNKRFSVLVEARNVMRPDNIAMSCQFELRLYATEHAKTKQGFL